MTDIGTAIQNVGIASVAATSILAIGFKIINSIWGPRKLHKECVKHHELFKKHISEQDRKDTDKHRTIMNVQSQMREFENRIDEIGNKFNDQAVEIGKITTSQGHMEKTINKIANKLNCV